MIINFVPKISGLEIDFEMNLLRLEPFLGIKMDADDMKQLWNCTSRKTIH